MNKIAVNLQKYSKTESIYRNIRKKGFEKNTWRIFGAKLSHSIPSNTAEKFGWTRPGNLPTLITLIFIDFVF